MLRCKFQESNYSCLCFVPTAQPAFFLLLQNFLLLDEVPQRTPQPPSDGKMIVHVQDFTAFWDKVTNPPLQDHNLQDHKRQPGM